MKTLININIIKTAMYEEGLSQNALSNLAHLNNATVSRLLKTRYGTPRTVKRVADALQCEIKNLILV